MVSKVKAGGIGGSIVGGDPCRVPWGSGGGGNGGGGGCLGEDLAGAWGLATLWSGMSDSTRSAVGSALTS